MTTTAPNPSLLTGSTAASQTQPQGPPQGPPLGPPTPPQQQQQQQQQQSQPLPYQQPHQQWHPQLPGRTHQPLQPLTPNALHSYKIVAPPALPNPASPPNKRDLKSWWKGFKLQSRNHEPPAQRQRGIFGIPLRESIPYANVAIYLVNNHGKSYTYGYVPIVVAKCGVFLKEKATEIEGIFRLSGSEKRIKELKIIFDSPERYGKGMSWDGYTVHDAANVLRRYLNDLPEPVVPLDFYDPFRAPLKDAIKPMNSDGEGPQFVENFNMVAAIQQYQHLITELPPLNRQLLLYILDLLAMFAAKADVNLMTSQNLAAIFQPGLLSHPNHDMAPEEYRLNQIILIFLIENQDHFLIGMQGTAADEQTVKDVQRGTPPVTPSVAVDAAGMQGVSRSASNASAGAESVARDGKIRRNRSTSSHHSHHSRHSRHSNNNSVSINNQAPSPRSSSPGLVHTTASPVSTSGGLSRSNTLPARSPGIGPGRFNKRSDAPHSPVSPLTPINHHSPSHVTPSVEPVAEVTTPADEAPANSPFLSPSAVPSGAHVAPLPSTPELGKDTTSHTLSVPFLLPGAKEGGNVTPSKDRRFPLFQRSPANDGEPRPQPNKLKKKRVPSSANPSAHSSTASLPYVSSAAATPSHELATNPLDELVKEEESAAQVPAPGNLAADNNQYKGAAAGSTLQAADLTPRVSQVPSATTTTTTTPTPSTMAAVGPPLSSPLPLPQQEQQQAQQAQHAQLPQQEHQPTEATLRPHRKSPSTSLHSSFNEGSDIDQVDDGGAAAAAALLGSTPDSGPTSGPSAAEQPEKAKKRLWRMSRRREEPLPITGPHSFASNMSEASGQSRLALSVGSNANAALSSSSIGSGAGPGSVTMAALSQTGASGSSDPTLANTETQIGPDYASSTGNGKDRDGKDGKDGKISGWLKNKYREAKESAEQHRRNKSPASEEGRVSTSGPRPEFVREKSPDPSRGPSEEDKKPAV